MKKHAFIICTAALSLALAAAGCGVPADESSASAFSSVPESGILVEYSTLSEDSAREKLGTLMSAAGVDPARQQVLFDHICQFNEAVSPESLTEGFEVHDVLVPKYDPYIMQEEWNAVHPDFSGYNCRITAFSLFSDFMTIPVSAYTDTLTFLDAASLEEDPSALSAQDRERFMTFYTAHPAAASDDFAIQVSTLQQAWREQGIVFENRPEIRLISVVFHDKIDEPGELIIGHTGILFPVANDELYLLEKLAFQEPYQLVKFKSRSDLNDYFMTKYDLSYGQGTSAPFIMENDQLMDGYHRLK